ncbi:hypothetical protein ORI20_31190 [Mycobacterium sp. CVI_P3]|uniref:Uncharacterized protein n=1 Tax=Mycobacterium pinniadriaticum TaxID=2994102 RepID=A0ABT3SNQ9_9MYCO|nr:hypothetical protein [Mycobacterium pinniadriaticum]MCX2934734.1 hypothetical protein [Mycobacterium pinniadriaticum]MCX2941156.1 hypothetical protein [Mycobacterium pinniadriaticum]
MARAATVDEWAAIAIGQSVGALGAIVIGAGWSITGPAEAARSSVDDRPRVLVESIKARLVVAVVAAAPLAAVAFVIPATSSHVLAAAVALVTALNGLTIGWYAVGTGDVKLLAIWEAVPRVAANLGGAALASLSGWIYFFPLVSGLSIVIPVTLIASITSRSLRTAVSFSGAAARLREQGAALVTDLVAGAYTLGASAIVGVFGTTVAVAIFNSGYRLVAFGAAAFGALSNALQGWIAESEGPSFARRVKTSVLLHTMVGLAGFVAFSFLGPSISGTLFGPALAVPQAACIPLGMFYALWSIETVTGRHVLATRGETRALLVTTALGSAIGVPAIAVGARFAGATGASWGLAGALALIVLLQSVAAFRIVHVNAKT